MANTLKENDNENINCETAFRQLREGLKVFGKSLDESEKLLSEMGAFEEAVRCGKNPFLSIGMDKDVSLLSGEVIYDSFCDRVTALVCGYTKISIMDPNTLIIGYDIAHNERLYPGDTFRGMKVVVSSSYNFCKVAKLLW